MHKTKIVYNWYACLKQINCENAFEKGPIGLFHLFLHKTFIIDNILSWKNNKMCDISKKLISLNEILPVIALELAMSTCKFKKF